MAPVQATSVVDNGDGTYEIAFDGPCTWNTNTAEETSILMFDPNADVWYNTRTTAQVDPQTVTMETVPPTPGCGAFLIYANPAFIAFASPPRYASIAIPVPYP